LEEYSFKLLKINISIKERKRMREREGRPGKEEEKRFDLGKDTLYTD